MRSGTNIAAFSARKSTRPLNKPHSSVLEPEIPERAGVEGVTLSRILTESYVSIFW
jgi:hypothetical protein